MTLFSWVLFFSPLSKGETELIYHLYRYLMNFVEINWLIDENNDLHITSVGCLHISRQNWTCAHLTASCLHINGWCIFTDLHIWGRNVFTNVVVCTLCFFCTFYGSQPFTIIHESCHCIFCRPSQLNGGSRNRALLYLYRMHEFSRHAYMKWALTVWCSKIYLPSKTCPIDTINHQMNCI